MDALVLLIPTLPLLAAAAIGIGHWFGLLNGDRGEQATADLAVWPIALAFFMAAALAIGDVLGKNQGVFSIGPWLSSDTLDVKVNFISTGLQVALATLFALLLAVTAKFAVRLLPKEAGVQRFFFLFNLFSAAFLGLLLSANMVGALLGWAACGWCAYGLVGPACQRPTAAAAGAQRLLISNRIGDAGFIIGIGLSYAWLQDVNWQGLNAAASELSVGQATGISLCFTLAACAKSAQLPFTPWLSKDSAPPLPAEALVYGAVMGHAGVFLVCLLQPMFAQSAFALAVLGLIGLASALYSQWVELSQTEAKSALAYAGCAQIGLMFVECSLGFWQLAHWHLAAHAIVRCWQFLNLPLVAIPTRAKTLNPAPAWLFMASLQRFWLEQITDWTLLKPIRGLAQDLTYFDTRIIGPLLGMPGLSTAQWPQSAEREYGTQSRLIAAGLAGKLTAWAAALSHWFESRLLLRRLDGHPLRLGQLGRLTQQFEDIILRPRYLILFICITFLMAF